MDITHQGGASFLITANPAIAINPGEKTSGVILHTDRTKAAKQTVCGPGEYEIRGALIVTVPAGPYSTRNLAHAVDLEGINVVFAPGSLTTAEEGTLTAFGAVDVLIVNADDVNAARTLVRDLE